VETITAIFFGALPGEAFLHRLNGISIKASNSHNSPVLVLFISAKFVTLNIPSSFKLKVAGLPSLNSGFQI
jgi:hypothetical protein